MTLRDPYPCAWPDGWPRATVRDRARFKVASFAQVRDRLIHEIELLGGSRIVITSNLPTRIDGLPYASAAEPRDPAVAVYWIQKGREQVMACDRWDRVRDNVHALELSVHAMRGIERWGSTAIVERAFAGFASLPAAGHDWRAVLGLSVLEGSLAAVKARYRELAAKAHPDVGGSEHEMIRLNQAMEAAEMELGA